MELRNYLDEHDKNVLRLGELLYEGDYHSMLRDMYAAMRRGKIPGRPPVSKRLENVLHRDIMTLYAILRHRR
mgnify:CR=1 FL=1